MKYKIEIWQYHVITETYESNDINDILKWYRVHWRWLYELGDCTFCVYKDGVEIPWDEEYKLGFHNDNYEE